MTHRQIYDFETLFDMLLLSAAAFFHWNAKYICANELWINFNLGKVVHFLAKCNEDYVNCRKKSFFARK